MKTKMMGLLGNLQLVREFSR